MKTRILTFFVSVVLAGATLTAANPTKPRIVVLTDSEVDDRCSMVHLLLHANDVDIAALIQTNSCFQTHGWSSEHWLEGQLDDYAEVYPNLKVHDPNYPTPDELRAAMYLGDEDPSHIIVDNDAAKRVPGLEPQIDPTDWADTPGSDRIVQLLLDDDPRTVYIQAWGGGNTAAKAFQKIKDQYPEQYDRAMKKAVMYNIWYQDGAGNYIETYHPGVTMLLCRYFFTWAYRAQHYTDGFVTNLLHNGHGSLATKYMQSFISEGDSPSFFYCLDNGLRSYEDPTWGGWGGQFIKVDGMENVFVDVSWGSYTQWIEYVLRDFEMRLTWCVTPTYENANHKPKIQITGELDRTVHSGDKVVINAEKSDDDVPDLDYLWNQCKELYTQAGLTKEKFEENWDKIVTPLGSAWWQYYEAGTYRKLVDLDTSVEDEVSFIAPDVTEPSTIHLIYSASDCGNPSATSYARVVVTVLPKE